MRIIPHEEYKIQTPLSKEEAALSLGLKTTKEKYRFGHINPDKLFRGEVSGDRFSITPIIYYRNNLFPVIHGDILEYGDGAVVVMQFDLNPFARAFTICWLCFCAAFFVLSLLAVILNQAFNFSVIIFLLLGCFGYSLALFSFNHEVSKTKKILFQLLSANSR